MTPILAQSEYGNWIVEGLLFLFTSLITIWLWVMSSKQTQLDSRQEDIDESSGRLIDLKITSRYESVEKQAKRTEEMVTKVFDKMVELAEKQARLEEKLIALKEIMGK